MSYNENLYYCIRAHTLYWKNLVSEIETKKLSVNQIRGFSNQLFLQKQPHFLHVDTNSQKLKVD